MITHTDLAELERMCADEPETVYPVTMPDGTVFNFRTELARSTYLNAVGTVNETTGKERWPCTRN